MGHLDPFLQDLNGIGIIAMMVGISAVIVRVVFCKTMRDRIYTGVGGLISAIVMSLGIDYAIRPFAGTGESTATNGLGFVQLMIGVVIALIGGAVLRGILSHGAASPACPFTSYFKRPGRNRTSARCRIWFWNQRVSVRAGTNRTTRVSGLLASCEALRIQSPMLRP